MAMRHKYYCVLVGYNIGEADHRYRDYPGSADTNGSPFPVDLPELNLRRGQTLQDGSREFATAICCVYANGSSLDSAIIFKSHGVSTNRWIDKLKALPRQYF